MYKYRKAIFVLFFCLLGDIAYSAEKYSKKSQKQFNIFLELSQFSDYAPVIMAAGIKIHKSRMGKKINFLR